MRRRRLGLALAGVTVASASLLASAARSTGNSWADPQSVVACVSSWSVEATPAIRGGTLRAVSARTSDDVWAVGGVGRYDADQWWVEDSALILRWAGHRWTRAPIPPVRGWLSGVAAIAEDDAWAVGGAEERALIEHWDGKRWSRVMVAFEASLVEVSAVAADDVWALGLGYGAGDIAVTTVYHWDGRGWKQVATMKRRELRDIVALSTGNVWAVGSDDEGEPLAAHWNGKGWREFRLPRYRTASGFSGIPTDLAARSPREIWVTGESPTEYMGTQAPSLWRWDGTRWRTSRAPDDLGGLNAIALRGKREVWTASYDESPHLDGGSVVHSRTAASKWRSSGFGAGRYVEELASDPADTLWAVGRDYRGQKITDGSTAYPVPLIERYGC